MSAVILRGDARRLPLPNASVDLVVTSPPYWGQRDYMDGGVSLEDQIGNEPTPQAFITALLACTREWARVLRPEGSIFVVLGDKYAGKSLLCLPERYRVGCVDQLGLLARAKIVYSKPDGMPESVTDRVKVAHEDVIHLTKQHRYYAAIDEIREAHAGRLTPVIQPLADRTDRPLVPGNTPRKTPGRDGLGSNPLGKLPGSVWSIGKQPLRVPDHVAHTRCCAGTKRPGCQDGIRHDAAFPTELPRRIILGWSPPGGIVVDPFGGAGTVALVADVLGRHGISVDLSADYGHLARWRITDPRQRVRATGKTALEAS